MNARLSMSLGAAMLVVLAAEISAQEAERAPARARIAAEAEPANLQLRAEVADVPVGTLTPVAQREALVEAPAEFPGALTAAERQALLSRPAQGGAGIAASPAEFTTLRLSARNAHVPGLGYIGGDYLDRFSAEQDRIGFGGQERQASGVTFTIHFTEPGRYLFECAVQSNPNRPASYEIRAGTSPAWFNWPVIAEINLPADRPEPQSTLVFLVETDNAGWGTVRIGAGEQMGLAILYHCDVSTM